MENEEVTETVERTRTPLELDLLKAFVQLLAFVGLMLAVVGLLLGILLGGCLAFDHIISIHSLSTRDAAGFLEGKFAQIKTGMMVQQVTNILGQPLHISRKKHHGYEWWYTSPKEPVEDWGMWDARYLIVSNDAVVAVYRHRVMNH